MSTTIFPKITWLDDDDIIEIITVMEELRLQYESNNKYIENQKAVAKRFEEMGSCSLDDLKDLKEEEEIIFIEQINTFSKHNSRYMANGIQLESSLLNKYGKVKIHIEIMRSIDCEIEARIFYRLNELDSEPNNLDIISYRENIVRENTILFSLLGSYPVMMEKEPVSLGYPITSRGEKIKISFLQKLKMVIS